MSSYTTNATVNLQMNGKEPKQVLEELKTRAFDLQNAIAKAASEGKKADLSKLKKELKTTQRQIREMESATEQVAEVMKRLDKASPKELQKTLRTLEKQLNSLERGSEAWERQCKHIKAVRAEIDRVNRELRESETFWERFNRKMNDWQTTIAAGAAAVTGLVMAGRSAVNAYAEMDAEMASVRKFTGMTAEEVERLNEEFKKIDTRTSREELNQLAQEAGRLGKTSQEDVLGFVRAADQLNVALDDLGDGATLTLSKLTNIFGDEARLGTERSLLAVGSVINELSQNCTASAPYLAQFAQRLAGVGAQAGLTIPQIMGFAAVLDSQGQAVEMSATAMSKLVMNLFKDTEKIAKATGLDLQEFNAALERSTNEGLLMLLERMKQLGGMDVLAPVFRDMGEEGARASTVISALAGNIDMVRQQQVVANAAFEEATSVTKEFNVQNTTVEAGLDKARKRVKEMAVELGEKLQPVMSHIMSSTTLLLKALSVMVDFFIKYKGEILTLAAAYASYTIAVKASAMAQAMWNTTTKVANAIASAGRTAITLLKVAYFALTGQIQKATAMTKAFDAAMKKNAIGLVISAITTAIGLFITWNSKMKDAKQREKELREENERFKKSIVDIDAASAEFSREEIKRLNALYEAATDENQSREDRVKYATKLQELYPAYFSNLDTEAIMVGNARTQYDLLCNSILDVARARAAQQKIEENEMQILDLEPQIEQAEATLAAARERERNADRAYRDAKDIYNLTAAEAGNSTDAAAKLWVETDDQSDELIEATEAREQAEADLARLNERLALLQAANSTLEKKYNVSARVLQDAANHNPDPLIINPDGGDTKDKFAAENEWRERQEALNRIAYAKGEKNYEQYTLRMQEIAIDYHRKQLQHTDLSALERLGIEADYYEAVRKKQEQENGFAEERSKEAIQTAKEQEEERYSTLLATEKQRYIDGKISLAEYQSAVQLAELEHLRRMTQIFEKGSDEYVQANARYQDRLIADQQARQRESERLEREHLNELARLKKEYFGNSPAENEALLNKDLANLKLVYDAEILAAGDNAAEKLRIDEAYEQAKLALRRKYGMLAEEENKNFILQSVEWLESDGGEALTGTIDTLVSGMSSIFSSLSSIIQAELEVQTAAIESRYDKEISMAEGNTYKVKKLEQQKEKEIAKLKNEANKKMFAMQVVQAVAQTAQNAISAYGSAAAIPLVGFILAPIAAATAIAAGALQIAAIKKQQQISQSQGYMQGGFTKPGRPDEVAGVVHAGEWVASQALLASPVARPMIDAMDYAQRTNTIGSLRADDVSRSITAPMVAAQQQREVRVIVERSEQEQKPDTELSSTIRRLNERLDEPFVTINTIEGDYGIKQAQDEYDKLIRNKTPKSRR